MTQRKGGLGRGLGALIPTSGVRVSESAPDTARTPAPGPAPANGRTGDRESTPAGEQLAANPTAEASDPASANGQPQDPEPQLLYRELPVDAVSSNPRQPRQVFDDEAIEELVTSIRTIGLLQPIVVRPSEDGYELVAGERRLRASKLAGLARIPALIRATDDNAMLRDALLENLHRVQLNPLEEAAAYQQLLSDFDCTQDELATRVGRSRPQVANTLRLLKLPPAVQRRVAAGVLSAGHARAILGAASPERMDQLAAQVVAEGLSVRAVEELVVLDADGEPARQRRRSRGRPGTPVEYQAAADRLGDLLETRVSINAGRTKGRVTIEFAGVDDLARIVALIERQQQEQS